MFFQGTGKQPQPLPRSSKRVLNIGAGFLPLVASDLDADIVYNYDPLNSARDLEGFWIGVFYGLIHSPGSGIVYDTDENSIRQRVEDYSIDLLLAISPFGFSVIDGWVDRKLQFGGQVLVAGNRANGWVTRDDRLIGGNIPGGVFYREVPRLFGGWAQRIEDKIRESYPSQTSALERSTNLDVFRRFVKAYR